MSKILIVEDEPNMRVLLKEIFEEIEDKGVELLFTDNGNDALEIIKTKRPELVILDVMMPKLSGYDVCNTVKNILRMKDIYILILTARVQEADIQKGKDVGADFYMAKPFNPDEILERAVAVLGIEM